MDGVFSQAARVMPLNCLSFPDSNTPALGCAMVAGGFVYLIKIRVKDMQDYQRFLGEQLAATPGVAQAHTYVVIYEVKSATAIPIDW